MANHHKNIQKSHQNILPSAPATPCLRSQGDVKESTLILGNAWIIPYSLASRRRMEFLIYLQYILAFLSSGEILLFLSAPADERTTLTHPHKKLDD